MASYTETFANLTNWTTDAGAATADTSRIRNTSAAQTQVRYNSAMDTENHRVTATDITGGTTDKAGIAWRGSTDLSQDGLFYLFHDGDSILRVYKRVAGVFTVIGSDAEAGGFPVTEMTAESDADDAIICTFNSVERITLTDSTHNTLKNVGVWIKDLQDSGNGIDDWAAEDVSGATLPYIAQSGRVAVGSGHPIIADHGRIAV